VRSGVSMASSKVHALRVFLRTRHPMVVLGPPPLPHQNSDSAAKQTPNTQQLSGAATAASGPPVHVDVAEDEPPPEVLAALGALCVCRFFRWRGE
jgi:hypothetical protein